MGEVVVIYQADYGVNLHLLPHMGEPYMDGPSDCLMMIPGDVICPTCKSLGCPKCGETGFVKKGLQ